MFAIDVFAYCVVATRCRCSLCPIRSLFHREPSTTFISFFLSPFARLVEHDGGGNGGGSDDGRYSSHSSCIGDNKDS